MSYYNHDGSWTLQSDHEPSNVIIYKYVLIMFNHCTMSSWLVHIGCDAYVNCSLNLFMAYQYYIPPILMISHHVPSYTLHLLFQLYSNTSPSMASSCIPSIECVITSVHEVVVLSLNITSLYDGSQGHRIAVLSFSGNPRAWSIKFFTVHLRKTAFLKQHKTTLQFV